MKISTHCFLISGLSCEPPWAVNSGFVVGRHTTLVVDTGSNYLSAQTIYGYSSGMKPQNKLLIVNSEPHFDHIGGNSFFSTKGIGIYAHPGIKRNQDEFDQAKKDFNNTIPNLVRKAGNEASAFYHKTELVNPGRSLSGGDTLDLGDVTVAVYETPGHTPYNLSFYIEPDHVLYCGDCIVTGYIPNLEAGNESDWHIWLQSIAQIKELEPDIIVPGHGDRITGKDAIDDEIKNMKRVLQTAIGESKPPTAAG